MFSLPDAADIFILQDEYSTSLLILSFVIACCACFIAFSLNQRIQQNSFFHRSFWLVLSATVMGLGVWSMHFIGMSALMVPVHIHYDVFLTVASIFPSILSAYIAFYLATSIQQNSNWKFIVAGVFMGLGITFTHLIGMAAINSEALFAYRPWVFSLAVLVAVCLSIMALIVFSYLQKYINSFNVKVISSVILGSGIFSMHYIGMYAVVFYIENPLANMQTHTMDTSLSITVITISISLLVTIGGLTSLLDHYVDYRLYNFDPLTMFPNQRLFEQKFNAAGSSGNLVIIHLHNLGKWNSRYGYTFGDKIIQSVSELMKERVPDDWGIYRIEGHRFAIVERNQTGQVHIKRIARNIMTALKKPLLIDHHPVIIDAVSAMAAPRKGQKVPELYSQCMDILNHSSIDYKHKVIPYDPSIHLYSFENQIVDGIQQAIKQNDLYLVYQPKVSTKTKKVSGLEALIRWEHPDFGLISPGVFIPILESNGAIFQLTDWIIEEVCKQISDWLIGGVPFRQVSINIPGAYLTSPTLYDVIKENIATYKINSQYIELEITETSVIDDIEHAIAAVNNFRKIGLSIALDDFGTGLSSLSNLRRIPISTVKIDKSFVDGIPASEKDGAVLKAIIHLCSSLNLNIIIEGVETKEQLGFILSTKEHPQIQGYYFSKPLAQDEIVDWVWKGFSDKLISSNF